MKITEINKNKGTRYTVYVDDEYFYILDSEIIALYGLKVGKECDQELLDEIKQAAQRRKAKERALYLLEYRDHSFSELVKKLEKSVDEDIAIETADKMVDFGFLNDQRYCNRLAHEYLTIKKWGSYKVKFELSKKGFARELIEDSIESNLETIDTYEIIQELVQKKYYKYLTDKKGFKKVTDALIRLGHNYSDVNEVLSEYDEEIEY